MGDLIMWRVHPLEPADILMVGSEQVRTPYGLRGPVHIVRLDGRLFAIPSDRLNMNPHPRFGLRVANEFR